MYALIKDRLDDFGFKHQFGCYPEGPADIKGTAAKGYDDETGEESYLNVS
jgi:hypothetical protein